MKNTRDSVALLKDFIAALVSARVKSSADFSKWRKQPQNEALMERCFDYERKEGMPGIGTLIKPFFHPTLPLIGLNYSQVAHLTLHKFENGWTGPMRLCRGIIFDRRAAVVAVPFPKFFNWGEQSKTQSLPDEPFVATHKEDGHLGIIFWYKDDIIATTRGCFVSQSSKIANEMLAAYKSKWAKALPKDVTLLCEVIHPETKVIVDYQGVEKFVVIGAYSKRTFNDFQHADLTALASRLGLEVVQVWPGNSIHDLIALVRQKEYHNKEGFVVRFASGLRIKFKYAGYIGQMIGEKITPRYIMLRMMEDGGLEKKFADLPGEVEQEARQVAGTLLAVRDVQGDKKAKWQYLYGLVPADEATPYHKGICRKFLTWLEKSGQEAA
jgi:RNA ligase